MTRWKCTAAYCGARYSGWQKQPDGNSIQDILEEILSSLCGRKMIITGSGRTDAKVNAWGQVFHFDSDLPLSERRWMGAFNGKLPDDIRIRSVEAAEPYFHARASVKRKRYEYRVNRGEYNVFTKDFAYQCPYEIDIARMKEAAKILVGRHDFTSFNSTPLAEMPCQVRTLQAVEFSEEGDELRITFTGKGFLRYMVRIMTGELLEVGRGRKGPEDILRMLEAREKDLAKHNAKPWGLTLKEVEYFRTLAKTPRFTIREGIPDDLLPEAEGTQYVITEKKDILGRIVIPHTEGTIRVRIGSEYAEEKELREALEEAFPEAVYPHREYAENKR